MNSFIGDEVHGSPDVGQQAGTRYRKSVSIRIDVLDERRAHGGPVAAPQFPAVNSVVGREQERVADDGQVMDRTCHGVVDVLDQLRAVGRAVRTPESLAAGAVVGDEETVAAHLDKLTR